MQRYIAKRTGQGPIPVYRVFTGYPADHIVNDASISWEGKEVYISGPPPMVDHTIRQLMINTEIDALDIECDSFV